MNMRCYIVSHIHRSYAHMHVRSNKWQSGVMERHIAQMCWCYNIYPSIYVVGVLHVSRALCCHVVACARGWLRMRMCMYMWTSMCLYMCMWISMCLCMCMGCAWDVDAHADVHIDICTDLISSTGPLTESEAYTTFHALSFALRHCHAHGIYHRDLKPDQVMFTRDMTPVLIVSNSIHVGMGGMCDQCTAASRRVELC